MNLDEFKFLDEKVGNFDLKIENFNQNLTKLFKNSKIVGKISKFELFFKKNSSFSIND